jgi:hypothetical protein
MTDNSSLLRGQKVRVTYEATFDCAWGANDAFQSYVRDDKETVFAVPHGATVEPIEDLHYGDVVVDDGGVWFKRTADGWVTWAFDGRPGMAQTVLNDSAAVRPFRLHFRNGKPVTS